MLHKWVACLLVAGMALGCLGLCLAEGNDSFPFGLKAQELIGQKDYDNAVPPLIEAWVVANFHVVAGARIQSLKNAKKSIRIQALFVQNRPVHDDLN